MKSRYGATAAEAVASRAYRSSWTYLWLNELAQAKTVLDLSYSAKVRAALERREIIEGTDFYLRALHNAQAPGKFSEKQLAMFRESAGKQIATHVKVERLAAMAAEGTPAPRKLAPDLNPIARCGETGKVSVVHFPKRTVTKLHGVSPALDPMDVVDIGALVAENTVMGGTRLSEMGLREAATLREGAVPTTLLVLMYQASQGAQMMYEKATAILGETAGKILGERLTKALAETATKIHGLGDKDPFGIEIFAQMEELASDRRRKMDELASDRGR